MRSHSTNRLHVGIFCWQSRPLIQTTACCTRCFRENPKTLQHSVLTLLRRGAYDPQGERTISGYNISDWQQHIEWLMCDDDEQLGLNQISRWVTWIKIFVLYNWCTTSANEHEVQPVNIMSLKYAWQYGTYSLSTNTVWPSSMRNWLKVSYMRQQTKNSYI